MVETTPDDLEYTREHDWVRLDIDGQFTVGISRYAADALGDIVVADLPPIGLRVTVGDPVGEIESTKSVSELTAPLSGEVIGINQDLERQIELVNLDPYGAGWLYRIRREGDRGHLLSATEYVALVDQGAVP